MIKKYFSGEGNFASVSMIHSVPELKVSVEKARKLGKADEEKLLERRKLVLLVDLDQTLIHTTNEKIEMEGKDVVCFQLYGPSSPIYHTKLRPYTNDFLETISKLFELHICTFGARMYAHKIAEILDPEKKLFSHRILSRDECFDPQLKTGNLHALFPCGDSMVCIIDDREDVWNYSKNLIAVRPYSFFANTGDINSPNRARDALIAKATKALRLQSKELDSSSASKGKEVKDTNKSDFEKNSDKTGETLMETDNTGDIKNHATDSTKPSTDPVAESFIDSKNSRSEDNQPENTVQSEPPSGGNTPSEEEKQDNKITDSDDYLLYLQDILQRIHTRFFEKYDEMIRYTADGEQVTIPDLKQIIPGLRKEVLNGVNIVFSGVIPMNIVPEMCKMWSLAKALGANVCRDIVFEGSPSERTTHLIAANLGTAKVQKALRSERIRIVNPLWLYTCADRWERVEERLYPLTKDDDFGNASKRKQKLTPDQQMFLNADLIRFACSSGKSRAAPTLSFRQEKRPEADFPIYDPITGKQIRKQCTQDEQALPSTSGIVSSSDSFSGAVADTKKDFLEGSSFEPHNMLEFSPLSAFSSKDLLLMDKEVEDACSEGDHLSSSSSDEDINEVNLDDEFQATSSSKISKRKREADTSSSEESLTSEFPKGWSPDKIKGHANKKRPSNTQNDEIQGNVIDGSDANEEEEEAEDEEDDDCNGSISSCDEEMGAALERDFLS